MRLLKDAFPAARPQRSPSSIRQQLWPKKGGAGGASWLSSSVLNPFMTGASGSSLLSNTTRSEETNENLRKASLKIPRLRRRNYKLPSNSRAHCTHHVLPETGNSRFESPLVSFRQRRGSEAASSILIDQNARRSNATSGLSMSCNATGTLQPTKHTLSLSLTHTHTHTHTQTHSLSLSLTHTHTHTHTLTLSLSHTHTHTHTLSLALSHIHTHYLTLSHTHSFSLTHTHTLSRSHSFTHTLQQP